MNPYFESPAVWQGFHNALISQLAGQANRVLPSGYYADVEVSLFLEELPADERRRFAQADVAVVAPEGDGERASGTATLAAPMRLRLPQVIEHREAALRIRDHQSRRIVTAVELLSRTNKRLGNGHQKYLDKRERLLISGVNLVEVDLLRAGGGPTLADPPACDYSVTVARVTDLPEVHVWPFDLRDAVPAVPLPLARDEGDVVLSVQDAIHATHDDVGYARWLYSSGVDSIDPPLAPDDAAWAEGLVQNATQKT